MVTWTVNDFNENAATYNGHVEERLGGRLITNDGYYLADANGTRIIIGGIPTPDTDVPATAVTWVPDTDVV